MSYADDIRTIAKTKEILDKADKALKTAEVAKKEAIEIQRSIAWQKGDGSKGSSVGNNGSGDTTTGIGNTGSVVIAPLAPPPNPAKQDNNQTENGSSNSSDPWGNSGSSSSSDPNGSNNNDKSDSATEDNQNGGSSSGGGSSRTDKKNQADPDNADPASQKALDWAAIMESDQYQSATDEQKRKMQRDFWATEKGSTDVGEAYEGTDGPKPAEPSYTQQVGNNFPQPQAETLKELVGVDPDDVSKAIALRFDGKQYYPSDDEAAAAGQGNWAGPVSPPRATGWEDWVQGQYVEGSGSYFATTQKPTGALLPYNSIGYHDGALGYNCTDVRNISDNGTNGGTYEAFLDWSATSFPINTGWVSASYTYTIITCGAESGTDRCPTAPETASAFPIVGMYGLYYINGKIAYSPYDSEVPLKYKSETSAIKMKSLVTGDTYSIEPGINGGKLVINETGDAGYFLYYSADNTLKYPVPSNQLNFYIPKSQ